MATVPENLRRILEARYGEEVRTAIYELLRDCYEFATSSSPETIDGRRGYDGTVYGSIGNAIRTQVSNLWGGIANATTDYTNKYNALNKKIDSEVQRLLDELNLDYETFWKAIRFLNILIYTVTGSLGKRVSLLEIFEENTENRFSTTIELHSEQLLTSQNQEIEPERRVYTEFSLTTESGSELSTEAEAKLSATLWTLGVYNVLSCEIFRTITDKSLTKDHIPADAQVVGDTFRSIFGMHHSLSSSAYIEHNALRNRIESLEIKMSKSVILCAEDLLTEASELIGAERRDFFDELLESEKRVYADYILEAQILISADLETEDAESMPILTGMDFDLEGENDTKIEATLWTMEASDTIETEDEEELSVTLWGSGLYDNLECEVFRPLCVCKGGVCDDES